MHELGRRRGTTSDRLRQWAIAVVASGPVGVARGLAVVAVFVGAAGELLLELGSAAGARPQVNEIALWCLRGLAAAGLAGLLADGVRRRRSGPAVAPALAREPTRRDFLTAAMLAAALVLVVALVPVYFLAARTHPTALTWNHFGFRDKRWLTSLFLCATAGSAMALAVAARAVAIALQEPPSWRAWFLGLVPARPRGAAGEVPPRRWAATAAKLVGAAALAGYFFGPPWNLPRSAIDYHEALTMGGVQAIRDGAIPYMDAAAVQYGPVAQMANYAYAHAAGRLSIDGFREVTLLFQWLAATIFLGALFLRVRPLVAAVTALAAFLVFPTLQTFVVTANGTIDGFWGWTDALRYVGVFLLAMAFPAIAARAAAAPARARSVALGAAWALLCLIAQENLIGGALVLGVLSVLLVVTDTIGRRAILTVLGGIAAGMILVAVPVCAYYAAHGELGRFIELYWLVPQAVAAGYSNTPFNNPDWALLFYGVPVLLGGLLLASLLSLRPLRIATNWTPRRIVLVSAITAAVISHLGALTRSDVPHLVNTELALPAAVCLAVFDLPGLLGARSRRTRWAGGLAIAAAALAILPLVPRGLAPSLTPQKLWRPLEARLNPPAKRPLPAGIPAGSVAAARIGDATLRQPTCCTKTHVPMIRFVRFMDRLHAVVGGRRTFVDAAPIVTPPVVYFLADLRPAPFMQDYGTMVLNNEMRRPWFRFFRAHLAQMQALVTTNADRASPRIWAKAFPRHRTVVVPLEGDRVLVLLRP